MANATIVAVLEFDPNRNEGDQQWYQIELDQTNERMAWSSDVGYRVGDRFEWL